MISCMNMGAIAASVKKATSTSDPYFSNVSLLLHCDSLYDSSLNNFSISNYATTISTATKKYGSGSLFFNSSYITIPDSNAFYFSNVDFTIEFFFNFISLKHSCFFQQSDGTSGYILKQTLYYDVLTHKFIYLGHNPASTPITWLESSQVYPSLNEFHHFAIVRSGSLISMYLDGVSIGSSSISTDIPNSSSSVYIGTFKDKPVADSGYINGYIDEYRITKGVARYTSNFTPPVAQFPDS